MTLEAGTRLGVYEIRSPLGAGGMGEVYRAVDTRLDREVAIKILPDEFANDPVLRKRFEREARTISSISHPNICKLFDIGESGPDGGEVGSPAFIVMELLEGRSLADRITDGPLPLEQALRHGAEIAEALDCAHQAGIVHRDLKPGNVMLTKTGARLLDFGLAKGRDGGPFGGSPDVPTQPISSEGALIGTIAYMAPEQLEGRAVDPRTDIFALGVLLYEMITGTRAFRGASSPSIVSSILRDDPVPMREHVPYVPTQVERLVRRCLSKDPDDRWQSARDLGADLRAMRDELSAGSLTSDGGSIPGTTARTYGGLAVAAIIVAAALGVVVTWQMARPRAVEPELFVVSMASPEIPLGNHPLSPAMALSPDGARLVYAAGFGETTSLFMRSFDGSDDVRLEGTENGRTPFFSPDGQWIAFLQDDRLVKFDLQAMRASKVVDAPFMHGGSWCEDGTIAFSIRRKVFLVSADGGTPRAVTEPSGDEVRHYFPEFFGGCRKIIYTAVGDTAEPVRLVIRDLDSGRTKTIADRGGNARFVPPDKVLFAKDGSLWISQVDWVTLDPGTPDRVLDGVLFGAPLEVGLGQFAVSRHGELACIKGPSYSHSDSEIGWQSSVGMEVLLTMPGYVGGVRVSPDGRSFVFWRSDSFFEFRMSSVHRFDLDRGFATKIADRMGWPVWSSDGRLLYAAEYVGDWQSRIVELPSDGSAPSRVILEDESDVVVVALDNEGDELIYQHVPRNGRGSIRSLSLSTGRVRNLIEGPVDYLQGDLSDDGHWFAYTSAETGQEEVFVRPYPSMDSRVQVSVDGGREPAWVQGTNAIRYLNNGQLFEVHYSNDDGGLHVGVPARVDDASYVEALGVGRNYDLSPDGQRVMASRKLFAESVSRIELVRNWPQLLLRRKSP